jgi:hypothetical protein
MRDKTDPSGAPDTSEQAATEPGLPPASGRPATSGMLDDDAAAVLLGGLRRGRIPALRPQVNDGQTGGGEAEAYYGAPHDPVTRVDTPPVEPKVEIVATPTPDRRRTDRQPTIGVPNATTVVRLRQKRRVPLAVALIALAPLIAAAVVIGQRSAPERLPALGTSSGSSAPAPVASSAPARADVAPLAESETGRLATAEPRSIAISTPSATGAVRPASAQKAPVRADTPTAPSKSGPAPVSSTVGPSPPTAGSSQARPRDMMREF